MENKLAIKKCDYCKGDASSLCFKCMYYFCDSCFKLAHSKEETKFHKKEKVDYYVPMDLRCPDHFSTPMILFCVDEKGNYIFFIFEIYIELCCTHCHFMNFHNGHKLLLIDDEESLKKENITLDDYTKEFDNNIQKLDKLKALIEEEMIKIDNAYESVDKEVTKSYEIKKEKLNKEENELKETLKIEVTKIKEKFEICLSEINDLSKISDKILKGVKNLENEEKNMNKTLSYVSKINKSQKEMKRLFQELMKNIKISYIEKEGKIKYDEYYFSGIPTPEKIKFEFCEMNNLKVFWNIENIKILNIDHKEIKYRIEIRKEGEKFNQINIDNKTSYLINNLDKNTNYEIRICSFYKDLFSNWSKLYKIKTFIDSIILFQSQKGNEYLNKLYEWSGYKHFELIYRGTRDGSESQSFHNKCDNQGPTLCLIKNDKDNIFGGFTSVSWTPGDCKFKSDKNSFLFTLSNIYDISPTKIPNTNINNSIYYYSKCGFIFGGGNGHGHDLCIKDKFLNNDDSYTNIGNAYKDILGKGRSIFTGDENNENKNIRIKELEVFKLYN